MWVCVCVRESVCVCVWHFCFLLIWSSMIPKSLVDKSWKNKLFYAFLRYCSVFWNELKSLWKGSSFLWNCFEVVFLQSQIQLRTGGKYLTLILVPPKAEKGPSLCLCRMGYEDIYWELKKTGKDEQSQLGSLVNSAIWLCLHIRLVFGDLWAPVHVYQIANSTA